MGDVIETSPTIGSNVEEISFKNLKFVIGGLLLLGIVVALVVQATVTTGAYYLTVSEIHAAGDALVGQRVRVSLTLAGPGRVTFACEVDGRTVASGEARFPA